MWIKNTGAVWEIFFKVKFSNYTFIYKLCGGTYLIFSVSLKAHIPTYNTICLLYPELVPHPVIQPTLGQKILERKLPN
jgi:hypothetical protein